MAKRLEGKVALVTGSTRGIGRAIAVMFASEGAKITITGRTQDAGAMLEKTIRAAGGDALYVPTDVGREEEVKAAVDAAVKHFGKLTTLINNAAPTELMGPTGRDGAVDQLATEDWRSILRVALDGVFWSTKYAVPEMIRAGGGSIVNISSGAAMLGLAGLDSYTAAKGALNSLTRSFAVEYAPHNIRANCLVVGMVLSSEGAYKMVEDPVLGPAIRGIHLTRIGKPEDIAYAATYLASDEAEFVTGAILPVDGGVTCKLNVPRFTPPKK